MRRVGYRRGIVTGLVVCAIGAALFIPAAAARAYPLFLGALFVLACGQCVLEVGANPYVTTLGPAASAPWRLNTAQAFNSLGAVSHAHHRRHVHSQRRRAHERRAGRDVARRPRRVSRDGSGHDSRSVLSSSPASSS
jgi:hypothetical protein